ncbi:ABC transporter substrate-binding protein [Halostagnicola kamekurae]|uniref:ABC-type branched-chain amino acid transport system, substrate-binding protein n=1 Tax=Halostagnicola kamekurae TaxID=619731 RepID=A0A1I6RW74_9EURY|nr:ABC transporter substrate-binding protein [Halostagnicola kamekurae]SFS68830.1 ABC-type branched-chain amino acid transport system, substrate-binding protein [Halostagnicola kamekurae]
MTRGIGRRAYLSATTVGAAVVLGGCVATGVLNNGENDERPSLSDRTLRYGAVLPLSGELESMGESLSNAVSLPTAELEASDLDVTTETETADSETLPASAVDAAAALVEDGYPALVGAAASGVSLQMTQQVTIPAEVVTCSPASTSPTMSILNDRGYSFRTAPDDSLQAVVAAQLAASEHDAATAATLYTAGDYGRQLSGAFSASFDGAIQRQVSITGERDSYGEPLGQALADEPDILFLICYPETGIDLLEEYYADHQGEETVFVSDALQEKTVVETVDDPMANVFGTAPMSSGPGQGAFESLYRETYETDPAVFAANTYDAAATLLLANAAAGENDGSAIAEQMREVTDGDGTEIMPGELADGIELAATGDPVRYRGAAGEIEFDENGNGGSTQYEYFRFDDDGITVLEERSPEVSE